MFKIKALALTTFFQVALAASDFSVVWEDSKSNKKARNPVKTWTDVGKEGSDCKNLCAQYAEDNYYVDNFFCSYQDEKPRKCTISAEKDDKTDDDDRWKKFKGTPVPWSLLDDNVNSIILGVLNAAEGPINTEVANVLEKELNPIKGDCNKNFLVDWGNTEANWKVKNPVYTWKDIGKQSTCKNLCAQYANETNYEDHFLCSYQVEKPHKCTISADDDIDKDDYSNWNKFKGTPTQPGQKCEPLSDLSDFVWVPLLFAGIPTMYEMTYHVKVKSCYPKNDWDSSLNIGPYTSITSDSYISPGTFLGSVGVVGDVDLSKLRCDASLSVNAYIYGIPFADQYSGKGGGTVTVSGSGKATVTMESKECDAYRCEKQDGRKLGGDPTSTPGSANARIGQQMSTDAFESRMLSGTQDCDDSSGCCAGQECDPSSATACGAQNPQCDYACVYTDNIDKEGIVLSPETGDIKLKNAEVDSCDLDLTLKINGIPFEVGDIVCDILKSDPFDLVEIIADAGVDAAEDAMTDLFAGLNTTCIPVSLPNEVSTYDMIIFFGTRFRYTHANLFCIYISAQPSTRRQTYHWDAHLSTN